MKKILFFLSIFLLMASSTWSNSMELLTTTWHFVASNGASEKYQSIPANSLNGKTSLTLTYDLHGNCILGGDASAIIFDQNGWKYRSLSTYGTNCLDGVQIVTISLSDFVGLNTNANVGTFHARFWKSTPFVIDITSAVLNAPDPTPYPTPSVSPSPDPTPTPSPSASPNWQIQSVDVMKYSKDVVCNPPSQMFIDNEVAKAVELGVQYVSISTPYQNPTCGNSLTLTQNWVSAIRAVGLHVWHRHMALQFEGIYSNSKHRSPDGYRYGKIITDWIVANQNLIENGDIFTPMPEPQNGGISGVTYCGSLCIFAHASDFNEWLRMTTLSTKLALASVGKAGVKVGYWGFDGFITWGDNNPDWMGHSFLESATVTAMDNIIT